MNLCSEGHEEVCYECRDCPVCSEKNNLLSEIDSMQKDIDRLNNENDKLNDNIREELESNNG